ncbi:MAG: TIGR01777 family protein [Flavobacteriales bacterium]|nr:TIGR01777 family protein [Flavobacteriales bacterium]
MNILIAGGTGLIGRHLAVQLHASEHQVFGLSRQPKAIPPFTRMFAWDPDRHIIDQDATTNIDVVINLAGKSLSDNRWTNANQQEMINSRVNATLTLYEALKANDSKPSLYIGASAVGYYPTENPQANHVETDPPSDKFLGQCCVQWEEAHATVSSLGIRSAIFRIGVVLSKEGGAFPLLYKPVKLGLGAALGTGRQVLPWIHIDDLCRMLSWPINNTRVHGTYNAASPNPTTQLEFSRALAKVAGKPHFLPAVPAFLLKIVLGRKAVIVLEGSSVSCAKCLTDGFTFVHTDLEESCQNLVE